MMKQQKNDLLGQFRTLWLTVQGRMLHDISRRIRTNIRPTEEELRLGAFIEEIEPQVREAVLTFNRKGYCTYSSGFYGKPGEEQLQVIDGHFSIDGRTKAKLVAMSVTVEGNSYTSVSFRATKPDLDAITKVWHRIAGILPDQGKPAPPADNLAAEEFRKMFTRAAKYARL